MEGFQNFNSTNFDPNQLAQQTSAVIMIAVVLDKSPSISNYVVEMNNAMRDVFMQELKNSHRASDIVIQCTEFNENVTFKSGFQPIENLHDDYLSVKASGSGTALYSAVNQTFQNISAYRTDLELQGIDVKTNVFIITDGEDNSSNFGEDKVIKTFIDNLKRNEAWANTFTFTMYGVGISTSFTQSCSDMGLDPTKVLTTIGADAKSIRNMMGVMSQSASSSSKNTSGVTF
jgi:uncharacterized protein YegL